MKFLKFFKLKICLFHHQESEIFVLETNATGRFVVSADKCGVINVWDVSIARWMFVVIKVMNILDYFSLNHFSEFPHPIRTIYEPYNRQQRRKLSKVALSDDGKRIVTTSDGKGSLIKLWHWSQAPPDGDKPSGWNNKSFGSWKVHFGVFLCRFLRVAREVRSCSECPVQLQWKWLGDVCGDDQEWNRIRSMGLCQIFSVKVLSLKFQFQFQDGKLHQHFPARAISISFRFVDTIFIENSHKAMSITSCGSVVVWSDVVDDEDDSNCCIASTSLKKEFIKSVKLTENALQVIRSVDNFVMISDVSGHIRFYDKQLKILFWCPSHDSIDSIVAISFDLKRKLDEDESTNDKNFSIRDFFVRKDFSSSWKFHSHMLTISFAETKTDIFSVDVAQMKFNKIFFKSDDFITAIDVMPLNRNLICCANYSGRIFIYDYAKKVQVVENRLKLQKRKSSTSDTDTFETPHVSALAFSQDGCHLLCGLENGSVITLDPNVLYEVKAMNVSHDRIVAIKFSPDSSFVTIYVRSFSASKSFSALTFYVRRMNSRRWCCCIETRHRSLMEDGRFWVGFVSMPKPFAMFCTFHRPPMFPAISNFHRDWFLWLKTEWVLIYVPTQHDE